MIGYSEEYPFLFSSQHLDMSIENTDGVRQWYEQVKDSSTSQAIKTAA